MSQTRKRQVFIAIICGVIAAAAMALYASNVTAEAKQGRQAALEAYGGEQIEIYVATRDIAVGEVLSANNASAQIWLSDLLPAGALGDQAQVFGQSAVMPIMKNEPIVSAKIGDVAAPVNVPDNLCAISIPVDDTSAVGGVIQAGAFVTVYASDGVTVELLAEEVLVLDTSNAPVGGANDSTGVFGGSQTRPRLTWVTLAVEPQSVQELIFASSTQKLHLVLPGGEINE